MNNFVSSQAKALRSTLIAVLFVVVASVARVPAFADDAVLGASSSAPSDVWFNIYFGESRIGGSHITTSQDQYNGAAASLEVSETSTSLVAFGTPIEQHVVSHVWSDPSSGTPLYETVTIGSGGLTTEVTAKYFADHIDASLASGGSTSHKRVAIPPGTHVSANDYTQGISSDHPVTVGQSFSQATFNPVTQNLDTYTIKIVGTSLSITDPVLGTVDNLVQCSVSGPDGNLMVYQDVKGTPVKIEMAAGLVMRRDFAHDTNNGGTTFGAGRFEGPVYVPPVDFATASAVSQKGASIDRPRECRKLKVDVTVPDTGTKTYTIVSVTPKPTTATVKQLAVVKGFAPYLSDEAYLSLGSDAVKSRAAKIRGTSDKAYDIVMKTRAWVHQTMHPVAKYGLPRSAASVLANPRGVCRDYAIVYAALARAQGVPTRLCSGLVAFRDKFYYHAWAESYVGGNLGWLPIDPTMDGRTVDATHITINRGDPVSIYDLVSVIGRVQVKVVEVSY